MLPVEGTRRKTAMGAIPFERKKMAVAGGEHEEEEGLQICLEVVVEDGVDSSCSPELLVAGEDALERRCAHPMKVGSTSSRHTLRAMLHSSSHRIAS